ncbi:MAG: multiheme c-type cytochrome [Planctomycetota bacterium]|nr:multiheme c-type cytochrome [Planctomycetota bacterium]
MSNPLTHSNPPAYQTGARVPSSGKISRPVLVTAVTIILTGFWLTSDWYYFSLAADIKPTYVGTQSCLECHQDQAELWSGSYHDLAMDMATTDSVLGNFDNVQLEHYGVTSTMFTRDGSFFINTEGPDGNMADFKISYVFGVEPLQQYLVEFDREPNQPAGEIARLQVLRVCWDTQAEKWFYLGPPDVHERLQPDDDLHWTGIAQRWNNMCADCHSTNLQKGFDVKTGHYHTTFSEMDVSCESCHGPGSIHVDLAESFSLFWDRHHGFGLPRLKGADKAETQIQTCAPCHSRRRIVHPDFRPGSSFYDHFTNEPLRPETYHADGQISDEVYVFGSFIQSKMYHKGIRCTDCHDPHSTKIKFNDNRLCTSCHLNQHMANKYDTPQHHFHKVGSTGASCVDCHMPKTTYMEVDPRRDHSLRVPRPDLSLSLGTPNACVKCHFDDNIPPSVSLSDERKSALHLKQYADWVRVAASGEQDVQQQLNRVNQWAVDAVNHWYPDSTHRRDHFGQTLKVAWNQESIAPAAIVELLETPEIPAIARASALGWLDPSLSPESLETAVLQLKSSDPQVRIAALMTMQGYRDGTAGMSPFTTLVNKAMPLLSDPLRSVRVTAVQVVSEIPTQLWKGRDHTAFRKALEELKLGMLVNNDRAATHLTLGSIHENMGDANLAENYYRLAMQVEPHATGPRANLAALLDQRVEVIIQRARQSPGSMTAEDRNQMERFAIEAQQLRQAELANFQRDAGYAPNNAIVQYRYGLALYRNGKADEALLVLRHVHELEPQTPIYMIALSRLLQAVGQLEEALQVAEKLVMTEPLHQGLVEEIKAQILQRDNPSPNPPVPVPPQANPQP